MRRGHFMTFFVLSGVYWYIDMEDSNKTIQRNDNHARAVIKLPSVITKEDRAEVKKLGYVFDPNSRLTSTKSPLNLTQTNIGTAFSLLKEEVKRSIGIY